MTMTLWIVLAVVLVALAVGAYVWIRRTRTRRAEPEAPGGPFFPMAVDSPLKRMSAINVSCPWRGILPLPDGTVGQPDRQVVPFMYSGITAGAPVAGTADNWWGMPVLVPYYQGG